MKLSAIISVFFSFLLASSMAMGMDGLANRINEARNYPEKTVHTAQDEARAKHQAERRAEARKARQAEAEK